MGSKSKQFHAVVMVAMLLMVALLAGCNRSATKAEPTPEPVDVKATEQTQQVMPTATLEVQPVEPDAQATADAIVATEQAQPAETPVEPAVTPEVVATETPAEPAPAVEQTYVVMPGDTLFSIGQTYGVTMEALAARNGIVNVNQLEVGQVLVIPVAGAEAPVGEQPGTGEQVHIVQAGENLFRISLQYDLSFETVAAYNGIPWPYTVYVGQVIKIPPTQ